MYVATAVGIASVCWQLPVPTRGQRIVSILQGHQESKCPCQQPVSLSLFSPPVLLLGLTTLGSHFFLSLFLSVSLSSFHSILFGRTERVERGGKDKDRDLQI